MEAFATMQTLYPTFTKTEQKIADFLIAETDRHVLLGYTLDGLAQEIGVGQASIMRFVKKCGYTNFRIFLAALYQSRFEQSAAARLARRQEGNSLLDNVTDGLRLCSQNLSHESLSLAAEGMRKADLIVCTGYGNSAHTAALVSARLRRESLVAVQTIPGEIDMSDSLATRSFRVVVLAFSVRGENKPVIDTVVRYAQSGSCCIAITSHVESSLAKLSNITFYAPSSFRGDKHDRDVEGMITQLFVAEALIEEYFAQLNQTEEES